MFFSPELLARRDSGFGLLWLAATLGSKTTFKKLPKRSVLTADITQLCDLIAEPQEPLALRLSSNLMVGVARVYKVKQEIFLSDVTTCFNSLKKAVQEIQSAATTDAQLQMAHPNMKSSALTLVTDPKSVFALEFDALVADWDEYLRINELESDSDDNDEFNPKARQAKKKGKAKASTDIEDLRANLYTLEEHHNLLLSASFDLSFNGSGGALDPSSSQIDGTFYLDDNFLGDGLDVEGVLGDELARELGEGWGPSSLLNINQDINIDRSVDFGKDIDEGFYDIGVGEGFNVHDNTPLMDNENGGILPNAITPVPNLSQRKRKAILGSNKENLPPSSLPHLTVAIPRSASSQATSFSHLLLSQDEEEQPLPFTDITAINQNEANRGVRRVKRTRLLLDARTELTDEELKTARAQYLQGQCMLKRDLELKRTQKESGKRMDDIVWGAPTGIRAQELVEFWQENFKVQVEARSGILHIHVPECTSEPPAKRRRLRDPASAIGGQIDINHGPDVDFDYGMPIDVDLENVLGEYNYDGGKMDQDAGRLRSSEEPGQGRRISRPPSAVGNDFELGLGMHELGAGSQKSSLFPWDNAGASSSSNAGFGPFGSKSDGISVDRAEVRMRGVPASRRESSIASHMGSVIGGIGFSPAAVGRGSQLSGEDFAFELPIDNNPLESQLSEINQITLERNSFNFLEYTRMQHQTLAGSATYLPFDTIVPKIASTRHVAAAAFYHCLVLATKDLLRLRQTEAYGPLAIMIL